MLFSENISFILKVQPDMDELTQNAEEPDEGEKPEVQKLGKLQYKVMICTSNLNLKYGFKTPLLM